MVSGASLRSRAVLATAACVLETQGFATAAFAPSSGSREPATCWVGGYSREFCCDASHGTAGNPACWDDVYRYDPCCTKPDPKEAPKTGESFDPGQSYDGAMLEQVFGAKLDAALEDSSLSELEGELRDSIANPAKRSMEVQTTRVFLALIMRRQGRHQEAIEQLHAVQSHNFSITASGAWVGEEAAGYHMHDRTLSEALVAFFTARKVGAVGDFGCGLGLYVKDFRAAGLRSGGFDGNPATSQLTEGRCLQADLSHELDLGTRWHWVLSLEVAEHIPREFEAVFLANLERHSCEGLVLSWGNQAGEGHVNLRRRFEVERLLDERGFRSLEEEAQKLRAAASLPWLQNTIMVFERRVSLPDRCCSG